MGEDWWLSEVHRLASLVKLLHSRLSESLPQKLKVEGYQRHSTLTKGFCAHACSLTQAKVKASRHEAQ